MTEAEVRKKLAKNKKAFITQEGDSPLKDGSNLHNHNTPIEQS